MNKRNYSLLNKQKEEKIKCLMASNEQEKNEEQQVVVIPTAFPSYLRLNLVYVLMIRKRGLFGHMQMPREILLIIVRHVLTPPFDQMLQKTLAVIALLSPEELDKVNVAHYKRKYVIEKELRAKEEKESAPLRGAWFKAAALYIQTHPHRSNEVPLVLARVLPTSVRFSSLWVTRQHCGMSCDLCEDEGADQSEGIRLLTRFGRTNNGQGVFCKHHWESRAQEAKIYATKDEIEQFHAWYAATYTRELVERGILDKGPTFNAPQFTFPNKPVRRKMEFLTKY